MSNRDRHHRLYFAPVVNDAIEAFGKLCEEATRSLQLLSKPVALVDPEPEPEPPEKDRSVYLAYDMLSGKQHVFYTTPAGRFLYAGLMVPPITGDEGDRISRDRLKREVVRRQQEGGAE